MYSYDLAVTKYTLSTSESFISCLSSKCGLYFFVEDYKKKRTKEKLVACPYCKHKFCLKCDRPWESHGEGGCDQAKKAEEAASEAAIRRMGAKPCPNCGVNTEKHGGCDHMQCKFPIIPDEKTKLDANTIL